MKKISKSQKKNKTSFKKMKKLFSHIYFSLCNLTFLFLLFVSFVSSHFKSLSFKKKTF